MTGDWDWGLGLGTGTGTGDWDWDWGLGTRPGAFYRRGGLLSSKGIPAESPVPSPQSLVPSP